MEENYKYEYKPTPDKYKELAIIFDSLGLVGRAGFGEITFKLEDGQIVLIEKKEKIKP